jgi:hypothetical protein
VVRTNTLIALIAILHSLKTHPTLEVLDLGLEEFPCNCEVMLMAIVEMLQVNTVIQDISLDCNWKGEELRIRDEMIRPLLEANAIRARVRALADASCKVAVDSDNAEVKAATP